MCQLELELAQIKSDGSACERLHTDELRVDIFLNFRDCIFLQRGGASLLPLIYDGSTANPLSLKETALIFLFSFPGARTRAGAGADQASAGGGGVWQAGPHPPADGRAARGARLPQHLAGQNHEFHP